MKSVEQENQQNFQKSAENELNAGDSGERTKAYNSFQKEAEKKAATEAKKQAEKKQKEEEAKKKAEAKKKVEEAQSSRTVAETTSASSQRSQTYKTDTSDTSDSATTGNDTRNSLIALARTKLGNPYVFGAEGPVSFDCSGFTQWLYRKYGLSIPRTAEAQYSAMEKTTDPQPGDLVFFRNTYKAGISHVGIYIGGGMMIHAANARKGIISSSISSSYYSRHFAGFGRMGS